MTNTEKANGNNLIHPFEHSDCGPFRDSLTKREYFAGLAMQGMLSYKGDWAEGEAKHHSGMRERMASIAVANADALLKELEK